MEIHKQTKGCRERDKERRTQRGRRRQRRKTSYTHMFHENFSTPQRLFTDKVGILWSNRDTTYKDIQIQIDIERERNRQRKMERDIEKGREINR